jgi:hypothetical protein
MQTGSSGTLMAGNLAKPLLFLYGTEWRERGYGLRIKSKKTFNVADGKESLSLPWQNGLNATRTGFHLPISRVKGF